MKRTYSYYSNAHRAFAHIDANNKQEVLEFAKANGDNIKLSDISLLMVNNVYVSKETRGLTTPHSALDVTVKSIITLHK